MDNSLTCINQTALQQLLDDLLALHQNIQYQAQVRLSAYPHLDESASRPKGAVNLAHYLALRNHDLRELQDRLTALGLSSLGRGESGIVDNLNRVIVLLRCVLGKQQSYVHTEEYFTSGDAGRAHLKHNTEILLGPSPGEHEVHIMVTLPSAAAQDYLIVKRLIENGMNCARINCAHDHEQIWLAMINNVRRASDETGKQCRVMMDLAGQKIRTGGIEPGPAIHHLKTKSDEIGRVIKPGYVLIMPASHFSASKECNYFQIAIDDQFQSDLEAGDRLNFVDVRGKHRHLEVIERDDDGNVLARCWQGAYLSAQTKFQWRHKGKKKTPKNQVDIDILGFTYSPAKIRVHKNDQLLLTAGDQLGAPPLFDKVGMLIRPAQIGISHSEILSALSPGAAVWIDDGKIGAVVESITEQGVLLIVTHARTKGALVKADKGVNFPDTELKLSALTEKDLTDLDFICQHADMLAYSFVQSRKDMDHLNRELGIRGADTFPVIAKIETNKAVRKIPEIILSTIEKKPFGIMIARGDLAVELGSVRMAEIQEEILWLCEAAHIPIIWATQVLETLAKEGIHSRPEITDAAMSVRAECVMLNKGPYILETVKVLNEILVRMQGHQRKKSARLRALRQWPLEQPEHLAAS